MKIGFISQALPYLPSREGFRIYGGSLIRWLSRRHEIDLVSLMEPGDERHLDWALAHCASVAVAPMRGSRLLSPLSALSAHLLGRPLRQRRGLARTLGLRTRNWDVVHVEGGYAGGILPDELGPPRVLSLHDSWTLRCEEMIRCARGPAERLYYRMLRLHEPRYQRLVYPRFDRCVVVAERDRAAVQATVPDARVEVIPYGIDTERFRPRTAQRRGATLLFHGNMAYAPNVTAALTFADEVFPHVLARRPDACFHVVAADPVPAVVALAGRPGVRLSHDLVDVRPALDEADVYVCALRHGTGMKNKMLEAMASGLAIVSYAEALGGIDCVPGTHVQVAQDPADFALHVVRLLEEPAHAAALGAAARRLMEERYGWDSVAVAFEDLYEQVRRERRNAPAARRRALDGPKERIA